MKIQVQHEFALDYFFRSVFAAPMKEQPDAYHKPIRSVEPNHWGVDARLKKD